jgi:hypothetical protein
MMKSIRLSYPLLFLCLMAAGCAHVAPRLVSLTPEVVPSNPSGIYTLSVLADDAPRGDLRARVVVGGQMHDMVPRSDRSGVFSFDYSIMEGANRARYYFELLDERDRVVATSDVQELRLTNRYVVELDSSRAQPGTSIALLGKGFRSDDQVQFAGKAVTTRFLSEHQVSFDVPAVEGGRDYAVALMTAAGTIPIGMFRVDYSELRSVPSRILMWEGESLTVVFTIDQSAPPGGMPLEMMLSDAALLRYEPVSIGQEHRSIHVKVEAGSPGTGTLRVRAPAHNELLIPVEVRPRASSPDHAL